MKKKAIIFDFDGVIIDSVNIKDKAFKEIVKDNTKKIRDSFFRYHKKNLGISRQVKFKYLLKNLLKKKFTKNNIDMLSKVFNELILKKILRLKFNSGVLKFFNRNKKKYLFFISSGTPQKELDYILKKKKINKYFKNIYGSPKSKTEHIKKIIKNHKLLKKNIIFIGDGESDLKAAFKANVEFIQFGKNFKSEKVRFKVNHFDKIDKIIYRHNILQ
jgi:HAD superfamily hydrolase (TIGR01549 family)